MFRALIPIFVVTFVAAALFCQTPSATPETRVPSEVDAALRARITQFYQLQKDGKYIRALEMVAEDTKDAFVASAKSNVSNFEIQSIQYSDNFSKAEVMAVVGHMVPIEGFMGHPLGMKTPSHWKVENGQWCYYEIPGPPASPFRHAAPARMPAVPPTRVPSAPPASVAAAPPANLPAALPPPGGLPGALPPGGLSGGITPGASRPLPAMPTNLPNPRALTVDTLSVELKSSGPSTGQVEITNPTPWPATLVLADPNIAGLTVRLEPLALAPRTKAMLKLSWSGGELPKAPIKLRITVRQTNQIIPIKISFAG